LRKSLFCQGERLRAEGGFGFKQDQTRAVQPGGKLFKQPADQAQTVFAAVKRQGWLETKRVDLLEFRAWNVGQVGADELKD